MRAHIEPLPRSASSISAQRALAEDLARLHPSDAAQARLSDLVVDFLASVLVGARTSLGQSIFSRYQGDGTRGLAFSLAYLAEISEYSHGSNRSAGHLGSTPLPVVLAYAALDQCPDNVATVAALEGYEAFSRVGQCLMPALEQWGSYSTGFSGAVGAAVAASRIMGLNTDGIGSSMGIAAYITPLSAMDAYLSGSNSAEAAMATTVGIQAAELALLGVTGSLHVLDDLHTRIVGEAPPPAFLRHGDAALGIEHVYWKPYPCCRFTHGAIQAVLELPPHVRPDRINNVEVHTTPRAVKICGHMSKAEEFSYLDRQFSLPFLVAMALLDGRIDIERLLGPSGSHDATYAAFAAERVTIHEQKELLNHGNICPTVLRVRLHDGTVVEQQVLKPWGCPEVPMTSAQIREKFRQAAKTKFDGQAIDDWLMLAHSLAWNSLAHSVVTALRQ